MQTSTCTCYNDDYFTVTSCKTFPIHFAICCFLFSIFFFQNEMIFAIFAFYFFIFIFFQNEIISLSEKYVRALSRENTDIVDGPYAGRFTAYGIYIYHRLYK